MELANQSYQRWLQRARERKTGARRSCWWREAEDDTRCDHPQQWVGPLGNDDEEEEERTRLNITFRLHSH